LLEFVSTLYVRVKSANKINVGRPTFSPGVELLFDFLLLLQIIKIHSTK